MTHYSERHSAGAQASAAGGEIDTTHAHPARVYACWLGGTKDAFAADRAAATRIAAMAPEVIRAARASRVFTRRAVTHLARIGVDQLLDLGSGLPTALNVHQVAQRITPHARVCYVDHDPVVLAHARALLATDQRTVATAGDLRHPAAILTDPTVQTHLDTTRPIGVLLTAVLHFVTDAEEAFAITATLRDMLAPGSHLALSHAADLPPAIHPTHTDPTEPSGPSENAYPPGSAAPAPATREAAQAYRDLVGPFTLRTPEQIASLLGGWEMLPPGLVPAHHWRPPRSRPTGTLPILAAVAARPAPTVLRL